MKLYVQSETKPFGFGPIYRAVKVQLDQPTLHLIFVLATYQFRS